MSSRPFGLTVKIPDDAGRRIWSHPERDSADIDLTVMTTNEVPESRDDRVVDFHELYWAHLMSETKPVAVLLWLYELCRKGPIMKEGINGLWWAASIFLCFMNLSVALLAFKGAVQFAQICAVQNLLVAPFLLISELPRTRFCDRSEMAGVPSFKEVGFVLRDRRRRHRSLFCRRVIREAGQMAGTFGRRSNCSQWWPFRR